MSRTNKSDKERWQRSFELEIHEQMARLRGERRTEYKDQRKVIPSQDFTPVATSAFSGYPPICDLRPELRKAHSRNAPCSVRSAGPCRSRNCPTPCLPSTPGRFRGVRR